mgnify:FL=1
MPVEESADQTRDDDTRAREYNRDYDPDIIPFHASHGYALTACMGRVGSSTVHTFQTALIMNLLCR